MTIQSATSAGVLPPPATPASPPGQRRVTRDDILALARRSLFWEFIPMGLRALQIMPDDHAMRLVVATAYAKLGLRTPAEGQLEALPLQAQTDPTVLALRASLQHSPPDEIPLADRVTRCQSNVAVLRARGIDLTLSESKWRATAGETRWFRTRDGNVVSRPTSAHRDDPWTCFRDDRAEAAKFPFPHLSNPGKSSKPYIIEGLRPSAMFERLYAITPDGPDGYRTPITIVQADPIEFLDGLCIADLTSMLADTRVNVIVGANADEQLRRQLRSKLGTQALGPAVTLATVRGRAVPSVEEIQAEFFEFQKAEEDRLAGSLKDRYTPRDDAWWRTRYSSGERLRVLIPTCRFSTFVKHSSEDLGRAFEAAGWDVRILQEPDDTSHLSAIAYLRELDEFDPDLVVLINYTRANIGEVFPENLPFVCWIQDAMPHQFSQEIADRQTRYDFLVGYVHHELFKTYKFPSERVAVLPVAVSSAKFHPGPVSRADADELACEIAYVSHHSETPDRMHDRLVKEATSSDPTVGRIFVQLRSDVERIARDTDHELAHLSLRVAAKNAARAVLGVDPTEHALNLITRQYAYAMADRIIRHETLSWAASIVQRRGWRLRLYGNGWDAHPSLREFAQGELPHDERLRASYATAAVHLHASVNWLLHQRVLECAMSGGLPVCRLKLADMAHWEQGVLRGLVAGQPHTMERTTKSGAREFGFAIADNAEAMRYMAERQRAGFPSTWDLWVHQGTAKHFLSTPPGLVEPMPTKLFGDLSMTMFRDEASLERVVERAVSDPAWRARASKMIADRAQGECSSSAVVRRMVDLVRSELNRQTTA